METEQAIEELHRLAFERDKALANYKQYQKNIDDNSVLEISDNGIFERIGEAYKKHQDLIIEVKTKSESLFKSLPAGMQFAVGVLGKSLFLGVVIEHMQPTKQWYVLVAKPSESTRHKDGTETVDKYACDVSKAQSPY